MSAKIHARILNVLPFVPIIFAVLLIFVTGINFFDAWSFTAFLAAIFIAPLWFLILLFVHAKCSRYECRGHMDVTLNDKQLHYTCTICGNAYHTHLIVASLGSIEFGG